jgi:hypothetical protein
MMRAWLKTPELKKKYGILHSLGFERILSHGVHYMKGKHSVSESAEYSSGCSEDPVAGTR